MTMPPRNFNLSKDKQLESVLHEIEKLEERMKTKNHDNQKAGGDLGMVQKLSALYKKRKELQA